LAIRAIPRASVEIRILISRLAARAGPHVATCIAAESAFGNRGCIGYQRRRMIAALPFDPAEPFALLWDRQIGAARLFTAPSEVAEGADVEALLARIAGWAEAGDWSVGALSYEAGAALDPALVALTRGNPWLRFSRHGAPRLIDAAALDALLDRWRTPAALGPLRPRVDPADWQSAVGRVREWIAAGDIYQANLTFPADLAVHGHPLALFARLFSPAAAPHGGVVHLGGGRWWLCLSPELFFTLADGNLTARPMKGTAPRAAGTAEDAAAARALAADPKNQAENLMITDLIRNDLSRVAVPGSVRVPDLFAIETYPSIHQMTSTVAARLRPGLDALAVLRALHPCGSITGAPKIRAMEIIAELEPHARGLYTGSLGWIGPGARSAAFSVAIRTLDVSDGRATLGLGSGIVADSEAGAEWAESLAKARFLRPSSPRTLIETMRLAPAGIARLDLHLDRLAASAKRFGFAFRRPEVERQLAALAVSGPRRLRLLLAADGTIALQVSPLPPPPPDPAPVALVPLPVDPGDWRLHHKTGDRAFYDEARRASGAFECLFVRTDGLLTEGSFTSLFVARGGRLLTPPARLGLLPGVLRAELLASGRAREAELTEADLADGFLLGNSLRGLFAGCLAGVPA
jgi:para-aminobenzoate synthetase/4-amino-4-deoxychorismate lyase